MAASERVTKTEASENQHLKNCPVEDRFTARILVAVYMAPPEATALVAEHGRILRFFFQSEKQY